MHYLFRPKKSRIYLIYLIMTHFFAMTCVWCVVPIMLFLFIFPCFIISFLYFLSCDESVISLQHDKKTEWILQLSDAGNARAVLLGSSVMLSHLLILHFKIGDDSERKTIVLFSDCFSSTEFRALRRCVRMGYL